MMVAPQQRHQLSYWMGTTTRLHRWRQMVTKTSDIRMAVHIPFEIFHLPFHTLLPSVCFFTACLLLLLCSSILRSGYYCLFSCNEYHINWSVCITVVSLGGPLKCSYFPLSPLDYDFGVCASNWCMDIRAVPVLETIHGFHGSHVS